MSAFDYSTNSAYFLTLCVKGRRELLWKAGATLGHPENGNAHLSDYGVLVDREIQRMDAVYPSVVTEHYVVMPNHIHLLLLLQGEAAPTISRIVQQFKGAVTKQLGFCLWQKSFHDHVIRNEQEYQEIWQYIEQNPLRWKEDCFYGGQ